MGKKKKAKKLNDSTSVRVSVKTSLLAEGLSEKMTNLKGKNISKGEVIRRALIVYAKRKFGKVAK